MAKENKAENSLQNKLQRLANGEDIELNSEEAILYGIDVADILPDTDIIEEDEMEGE